MAKNSSRARMALFMILALIAMLRFEFLFWLFPVLAAALGVIGAMEFCRMIPTLDVQASRLMALAGTGMIVLIGSLHPDDFRALALPAALVILIATFITHMFAHGYDKSFLSVPMTFFPVIYIGLPLACGLQIARFDRIYFLFGLALVWASDIGAYYSGMRFGRHKLAPTVSPKKTVEGAIGGVVVALAVAVLFQLLISDAAFSYGLGEASFLALLVSIIGPFGDLSESMLKRDTGVKDSGGSLGGHGGVLDRIDSTLFCFPILYGFLVLTSRL